jgi:REP element-mobilizing transposase RayT
MPNYRRAKFEGGTFFFTVTLADRRSNMLVSHIDRLRAVYREVQKSRPFESIAVCVLPDHLHAIWSLPRDDADFAMRWNLIRARSRAVYQGGIDRQARWPNARKAFGKGAIGSMPFETTKISLGTSTTSISIQSSTALYRVSEIGRTAVSINT